MRRILLTAMAMLWLCGLRAQADSIAVTPLWRQPAALAGAGLVAAGSAFTFSAPLHDLAKRVNASYVGLNLAHYHFDDYIQYLPAAVPLALGAFGVRGEHRWVDVAGLTACSYLLGAAVLNTVKYVADVERPSGLSHNSFPSGHTFTAFTGAEIIRREYGSRYPLLAVGGYAVATLTAFMRLHNNMHWLSDLSAGAGLALISVGASYWIGDCLAARAARRHAPQPDLSQTYLLR